MLRLQTALGIDLPPVAANIAPEDLRRTLYDTTSLYSHCNIRLVQDGKLIKDVFLSRNLVVVVESPLQICEDIKNGLAILSSRYACDIMTTSDNTTNNLTPEFVLLLKPHIEQKHEPVIILLCYSYRSRVVVLEKAELCSILNDDTNSKANTSKNRVAALLHRDFSEINQHRLLTVCVSQKQVAMFATVV